MHSEVPRAPTGQPSTQNPSWPSGPGKGSNISKKRVGLEQEGLLERTGFWAGLHGQSASAEERDSVTQQSLLETLALVWFTHSASILSSSHGRSVSWELGTQQ